MAVSERLAFSTILEEAAKTQRKRWHLVPFVGRSYGDCAECRFFPVTDFSEISVLWGTDTEDDGEHEYRVDDSVDGCHRSFGGGTDLSGTNLPQIERLYGNLAFCGDLRAHVWALPWKCGAGDLCFYFRMPYGNFVRDQRFSLGKHSVSYGSQSGIGAVLRIRGDVAAMA